MTGKCYNGVYKGERTGKMREENKLRLKSGLMGAGLSLFFCALCYGLSAIIFSELKLISEALFACLILSVVSAGTYLLLETLVFSKTRSSAFSIGYFGTVAILSALVFFATSILPMDYIFDYSPQVNSAYLKQACIRFCIFNAVTLVYRLGQETFRYIKNVFGKEN